MLESVIKRHIFTYLSYQREFYGWVETTAGIWDEKQKKFRRRTGTGMRCGVADIVGIWNGRGIAIEIKTPKGRLSPSQIAFLSSYKKAGGLVCVLRSVDDCVVLVNNLRSGGVVPDNLMKEIK